MGLIISRFRRKKTTTEVLEKLESKIKSIEQYGQSTEQKHRKVVGYVMIYSIGLYLLFAVLYYFMYIGRSQHWLNTILYASPLLVLPIVIIFLRSGISYYYNWSLSKNRTKLNKMQIEKKKILEEVMNTETYKVAKEILDKYGNPEQQSKAFKPFVPSTNIPGNSPSTPPSTPTPGQIRQRQLALQSTPVSNNSLAIMPVGSSGHNPRLSFERLPRPVVNNPTTFMDKMIDFFVREGPNYRMALICKECWSHNGMALIEEFEFVSYKCAYCGAANPARRARPPPPALPAPPLAAARRRLLADDSTPQLHNSTKEEDKNDLSSNVSDYDSDRPPSPLEEEAKSDIEKKED